MSTKKNWPICSLYCLANTGLYTVSTNLFHGSSDFDVCITNKYIFEAVYDLQLNVH